MIKLKRYHLLVNEIANLGAGFELHLSSLSDETFGWKNLAASFVTINF